MVAVRSVRRKAGTVPAQFVTIKEAAQMLGVSEVTLRRWDQTGKFKAAKRGLTSNWRLYAVAAIARFKRALDAGARA